MPAVSKKQQRFMGMIYAVQKGEMPSPSKRVAEVAKDMAPKAVKHYAKTKRKGLPTKKESVTKAANYERLVALLHTRHRGGMLTGSAGPWLTKNTVQYAKTAGQGLSGAGLSSSGASSGRCTSVLDGIEGLAGVEHTTKAGPSDGVFAKGGGATATPSVPQPLNLLLLRSRTFLENRAATPSAEAEKKGAAGLAPLGGVPVTSPASGTAPAAQAASLLQQFGPRSLSAGLAPFADTRAPGDAVRGTPLPNVIGLKGPMRVDGTFDGSNAGQDVKTADMRKAACDLMMGTQAFAFYKEAAWSDFLKRFWAWLQSLFAARQQTAAPKGARSNQVTVSPPAAQTPEEVRQQLGVTAPKTPAAPKTPKGPATPGTPPSLAPSRAGDMPELRLTGPTLTPWKLPSF